MVMSLVKMNLALHFLSTGDFDQKTIYILSSFLKKISEQNSLFTYTYCLSREQNLDDSMTPGELRQSSLHKTT